MACALALVGALALASPGAGGAADPPAALDSAAVTSKKQGKRGCPVRSRLARRMTLTRGCKLVLSDTGVQPPGRLWGAVDCASRQRARRIRRGGERQRKANGRPQHNRSFRRLRVVDGDNQSGERCELGFNSQKGPTAVYHEGQRRITFASLRLPPRPSVQAPNWRVLMQIKQAAPYNNRDGPSMFELQLRNGHWYVESEWNVIWTAPARPRRWTRFAFDVVYSQDPAVGSIKVYVDRNGDGDARDAREQSPRVYRRTLLQETPGGPSPVPPGGSVPSHLRAGLYQDDVYQCPPPRGCWVDLDNVQVLKP